MSRFWRRPDDPPRPGIAVYPGHGHEVAASAHIPDRPAQPPDPPPTAAGTGRLRGTLAAADPPAGRRPVITPVTLPPPPPPPGPAGQVEPTGDPDHPVLAGLRRELAAERDERDGLTVDQQIRAIALQAACGCGIDFGGDLDQQTAALIEVAAVLEVWIRDGQEPTP